MAEYHAPLSDEDLTTVVETYARLGSHQKVADALKMSKSGVQYRMSLAARRGLCGTGITANYTHEVLPGFAISKVTSRTDANEVVQGQTISQRPDDGEGEQFAPPTGHMIKGISALVDAQGNVINQWIKTRLEDGGVDWPNVFAEAFKDYGSQHQPVGFVPNVYSDYLLNFIPCNDWHINMLAWSREVEENWDLKIAEEKIGNAIVDVIKNSPPASQAVVLGGGDLMHNDDNTNRTAKSHNVLDADGRHQKGIEVAQRLKVLTIDTALQYNDQVIVRILPGNHDEYSSVAVGHFLAAWYRNEPRVVVDLDASLFWFYQFGRVMLAATHGHTVKLAQMPAIMAHRRAKMWGETSFRYAHGFHVHHKSKVATEGEGVICESHQAPIPQDSWHYGSGYLSGRSVQTITYHRRYGEISRKRTAILDGDE